MTPRSVTLLQRPGGSQTPSEVSSSLFEYRSGTLTEGSSPGTPDNDPNSTYVRLKMRLSELTTHRKTDENADASFVGMLKQRLEEVRQDYLFVEREAESAYRAERKKADDLALQSLLRGELIGSPPTARSSSHTGSPAKARSPDTIREADRAVDVFDEDNEAPGGFFELLEELPQSETTKEGVTIQIRDMPVPKGWSGKTPRTLLLELAHRTDKVANVNFSSISGASRAQRAAVRIIWQQGNISEWSMEDVACHDAIQAQQYISTVALHGLAFPSTPGFAVGGTTPINNQTSYRLLPPLYRDLWNELEEKRRAKHDCVNREIWGKLRRILEPKLLGTKVSP